MTDLLLWLAQGRALRAGLGLPTATRWIPASLPENALLEALRPHIRGMIREMLYHHSSPGVGGRVGSTGHARADRAVPPKPGEP